MRLGCAAFRSLKHTAGRRMKYAIVHDWLVTYAGAERVLQSLLELLPDADYLR